MGGFFGISCHGSLVLLLFGGNRFSAMMGDVVRASKLKQGLSDEDKRLSKADPAAAADRHYAAFRRADRTSDAARGRRSDALVAF
jgi:hypothetical protein